MCAWYSTILLVHRIYHSTVLLSIKMLHYTLQNLYSSVIAYHQPIKVECLSHHVTKNVC